MPTEDARFPGAGVSVGCELWVLESKLGSSKRTISTHCEHGFRFDLPVLNKIRSYHLLPLSCNSFLCVINNTVIVHEGNLTHINLVELRAGRR